MRSRRNFAYIERGATPRSDKKCGPADNAYPLSNVVLIPYKGAQQQQLYKSSYNFYPPNPNQNGIEAPQLNEAGLLDDDKMERLGIDRLGDDDHGFMAIEYDAEEGTSSWRDAIVQRLTEETIIQPQYNVHRNNNQRNAGV